MIADTVTKPSSVLASAPDFEATGLPQWYQDLQRSAWETSSALPLPKRTDEAWRFADLKRAAALEAFQNASNLDEAAVRGLISRSDQLEATSGKFVFANEFSSRSC